jgi:hypothetical protein
MSEHDDLQADLPADAAPDEAAALRRVTERLQVGRGIPDAAFRGALRRRLLPGQRTSLAPARVRLLIVATGSTGTLLLLIVAASVAGAGPLAT